MGAWDALLSWCRCELSKEKTRTSYEEVKRRRAELAALCSPAEVLELLDRRTSAPDGPELFDQRDRVLRALIEEHQGGTAAFVQPLLILAFAPTLISLHRRFPRHAADGDLVNLVLEVFLEQLGAFPAALRSRAVALRLARGTEKLVCQRLGRELRREAAEARAAVEVAAHSDLLEVQPEGGFLALLGDARHQGLSPDDVADAERALAVLVERRVIKRIERHLLLVRVHGRQLKAWLAKRPRALRGMRYEAAKKRLQRATIKVENHLRSERLTLSELANCPPKRPPGP